VSPYEAIESSDFASVVGTGVGPAGIVEGALHELAHAAVFGISLRRSGLIAAVAARFKRYVRRRSSDRSECAALAVEAVAARRLGIRIQLLSQVIPYAVEENMKMMRDRREVRDLVLDYMQRPVTKRRAARVVRHVRALEKESEGTR
jgi:hypothetical protein